MANPEIFVKAPFRGPSILMEIGRLVERHELAIKELGWSRDIGCIIVQFPSDADLVAFKLVCPFETMNKADGRALLVADQAVREKEAQAVVAQQRLMKEMYQKLTALEAENETTLCKGSGAGR